MTYGVAMIARNGAATMQRALAPFRGWVDDIAIVLGGASTDDTAAIAREITSNVTDYRGDMFRFDVARQQSFDALTTGWVIMVDCDDIWTGAELIPAIIAKSKTEPTALSVEYHVAGGSFYQPRVYQRAMGRWQGAVHEAFVYHDLSKAILLKTSEVSLRQDADDNRSDRIAQNIAIGEAEIRANPRHLRQMAHLIKDYIAAGQMDDALKLCHRYLSIAETPAADSEKLSVLEYKAALELEQGDLPGAMATSLQALDIQESAMSYSCLGEAAYRQAKRVHGGAGLYKLALWAADRALAMGKYRGGQFQRRELSGSVPCTIKAMALNMLGRQREALAAADLGRMLDPTDERLQQIQAQLAYRLNEAA